MALPAARAGGLVGGRGVVWMGDVVSLTDKQQMFVEVYLTTFNATEAAAQAGYSGDRNTLGVTGWENLRKPKIAEAIKRRLEEAAMTSEEVIMRLAAQGRGNIGDFLTFHEGIKTPYLDLKKAKELGLLGLVKKLKYDKEGRPEIELYDAQAALEKIGRALGIFKDEIEHKGELTFKVVYGDDGAND